MGKFSEIDIMIQEVSGKALGLSKDKMIEVIEEGLYEIADEFNPDPRLMLEITDEIWFRAMGYSNEVSGV